jgi:CP family cyanate transporter-like MFS transporter
MALDKRIFAGVLLAAFNLRIGIATVGPVVDEIRLDTGMSSGLAGVLTAIPFLCMGAFALAGTSLVRQIGFSRLLWLSLGLIAAGSIARVGVESSLVLLLGTLPIGIGVAFAGAVLPGVIRRHFAARAGAATGGYVASSSLGGAIAALSIVPLVDAVGSWRWGLMLIALPAVVALVLWPWAGVRPSDMPTDPPTVRRRRPSRTGALLGLMFGFESAGFSALMGWVAPVYIADGWSVGAAGSAAAVILLVTVPASLIVPALSDGRDRRVWIVGCSLFVSAALAGLAVDPSAGGWLWVAMAGIGLGAMFPLMLALPVDLADTALAVTDLSAWMQGIGYTIAAAAPVLIGALRDATGGFETGLWLMAGLAVVAGLLGIASFPAPARPASETA